MIRRRGGRGVFGRQGNDVARDGRWSRVRTPWVEGLEDRRLLATITWVGPNGGDWDTASNWSPAQVPTSADSAVVTPSSAETILHGMNSSDAVLSLTTNSDATLTLTDGSISIGVLGATIGGPVTVESGASLNVGAGASVTIQAGQTLTDNGALTFAADDTVSMGSCCYSQTIAIGGTLTAVGTTFTGGGGQISVNTGGELIASDSTFSIAQLSLANSSVLDAGDLTGDVFNMPISVPYNDVQYLGGNASFNQININAGTLTGGCSTWT